MKRNSKKNKSFRGPVSTIGFLLFFVAILSFILNKIGFEGYVTSIGNNGLEANLVTVNNFLSIEGIKYFIGNIITNFKNFEPLFSIIIALIGISICEKSGLFRDIFTKMKNFKYGFVIFLTLFISIIASFIGDASFVFIIPTIGIMYKYMGKNPMVGLFTAYVGLTLGYGIGVVVNYNDYLLGTLTEAAATVDVDKNYIYNLSSTMIISWVSIIIISICGYFVIDKFLVNKFPKRYIMDEEEIETSKKAMVGSSISFLVSLIILIYLILDVKLPGAGILLDKSQSTYIAKLFSNTAPFSQGIVLLISLIMILCGATYGKISKNIKNSNEYSLSLSKSFEGLGLLFVLSFFMAQFVAILDWTNIGTVLCARLMEFLSSFTLSGVLLIILFFVFTIIISIFIPGTLTKWQLMAPTVIPLFMRANISPDFTQFIFKIADSVGKIISPSFIYFIILISFLEKYRTDDKKQITFLGTLKLLSPVIAILAGVWIVILCLWYVAGFPIGIGVNSVL